jgi:peptidoglycan hydrolase CwlO-like protein
MFQQLTKAEYEKLTLEERVEYMRELVNQVHHQIEETRRAIEARDELLKPKE